MRKTCRNILLSSLIFSQIFINTSLSFADSIILNKDTTDGVNVRALEDRNSEILGGIEDFSIYEIKGESEDWYEIEFDGQKGYVGKNWFFRLNHTSLIEPTNLKSCPDSDSSNLTDYKLQEKTKVTILEFDPDTEFVKISYDEAFRDNKDINVRKKVDPQASDLLFTLAEPTNKELVKTVTLADKLKNLPSVVTLSKTPATKSLEDLEDSEPVIDENLDNVLEVEETLPTAETHYIEENEDLEEESSYDGPIEGYVKLSSLAISKKDEADLDSIENFYDAMNAHIKIRTEEEEALLNQVRQITETYYVTTTTTSYQELTPQTIMNGTAPTDLYTTTVPTNTITVPVTGSETGIELYKWATQFLGNPYVLGGVDLYNGIDCSGFTMQIYRNVGINLPHFAQSQQRYGMEIPWGQERAGDLVFYGTSLNNITHVGMADGHGNMIHASSPRVGIIISPIRNPISIKRLVH